MESPRTLRPCIAVSQTKSRIPAVKELDFATLASVLFTIIDIVCLRDTNLAISPAIFFHVAQAPPPFLQDKVELKSSKNFIKGNNILDSSKIEIEREWVAVYRKIQLLTKSRTTAKRSHGRLPHQRRQGLHLSHAHWMNSWR